jgi:hypothetical protein
MPVVELIRRIGITEQAFIAGKSSIQVWTAIRQGSSNNFRAGD